MHDLKGSSFGTYKDSTMCRAEAKQLHAMASGFGRRVPTVGSPSTLFIFLYHPSFVTGLLGIANWPPFGTRLLCTILGQLSRAKIAM